MKQGYGSADSDKVGKEIGDKPMLKPGAKTPYTGQIGGPSNEAVNTSSEKSGKSANEGSEVATPARQGIAPYNEGGFRNKAMEHKRG